MRITVNGESSECDAGTLVKNLLGRFGVNADAALVERNGKVLDRERYADTDVADGDVFEIVRFVGGG